MLPVLGSVDASIFMATGDGSPLWDDQPPTRGRRPAAGTDDGTGGEEPPARTYTLLDALDADLAWLAAHRESLPVAVRPRDPRLPASLSGPWRPWRSKDVLHDEHPPTLDQMPQVVRHVLDQLGRLFLPALDFDDFRDQDVIGSFS